MSHCFSFRTARWVSVAIVLMSLVGAAFAQQEAPKSDLFVGYAWSDPGGQTPYGTVPTQKFGWGADYTYNFNKWIGVSADFGGHYKSYYHTTTAQIGPRVMWRTDGLNIFAHTLFGLSRFSTPGGGNTGLASTPNYVQNNLGATLGGGIDLPLTKWASIRLIEADYLWAHYNFQDVIKAGVYTNPPTATDIVRPTFNGVQLRSGLVFNFGELTPPAPLAAACSAQGNTEVYAGEPVSFSAATSNILKNHSVTYAWSGTGGKVSGKDNTASVDTTGLAPGSYTVSARVSDAKMKKGGDASCSSNFTVKNPPPKNPPVMSCSASPTSVQAGASVSVTCTCTSPDGVPVSVASWTTSAGRLSGGGSNASIDTTGAAPGSVSVAAVCTDSRGLTANSSAGFTVENPPPPPPKPVFSKLNECAFPNKLKPWRVDNACKAILDDVALRLQREADAKATVVGYADAKEKMVKKGHKAKAASLAAERAVDAKAYLTDEKGIDGARIDTRTSDADGQKADFYIVPAGASAVSEGTAVDESKVKAIPDHPKKAMKKMASKAKAATK